MLESRLAATRADDSRSDSRARCEHAGLFSHSGLRRDAQSFDRIRFRFDDGKRA